MATVPNSSVYHSVPIMRQPQTWACWYTSFQMVVSYQRRTGQGKGLRDPSEVPWVQTIFTSNQGIGLTPNQREQVAVALGFKVLYASVTAAGVWALLNAAPVIYAGRWPGQPFGHFVVLVGISDTTMVINNPATGMERYDYNWFLRNYLLQTAERPLIYP
jgi:ABC-type bacteriocin/lantibiotic exporter with double-glycine peptidase domain